MFMIPSPQLGRLEDIYPERVTAGLNEWIELSRKILKRKRDAAAKGQFKPNYPIDDDAHRYLHPFGAQYCPALQEMNSVGYVLKWPVAAVVHRVKGGENPGWLLKTSGGLDHFYKYHWMTSFHEAGEAEAISINTGWSIVTPPGWSVMVKGLPNNLTSTPGGLKFAEGIIRTDQAVLGLQVHAVIPKEAPDRFEIKRGEPMLTVFPFKRESLDLVVVDDPETISDTAETVDRFRGTMDLAPGLYHKLYMDDFNPAPFYDKLVERWREAGGEESPPTDDADADDSDE